MDDDKWAGLFVVLIIAIVAVLMVLVQTDASYLR